MIRFVKSAGVNLVSIALAGILCLASIAAYGQAPATNLSSDPLMNLMLSQPRIELGAPVTAISWFDPPVVQPNQLSYYRVAFNALEESIEWPEEIHAPANLHLRTGARGQFLQSAGATTEPRTTFSYRTHASEQGEITIPSFKVQVYGKSIVVPAAHLQVTNSAPGTPPMQLILEIANTNLFVGQPANVRILLPGSVPGLVQVITPAQLIGQGFIMDQGALRQKVESSMRGGLNVMTFIHETMLIPVAAGKISLHAQGFTTSPRVPLSPTNLPYYVLVESDPIELNVKPLPKQGELPGFTGAIGAFNLDPPKLTTNTIRVGDPVKLSVTVHAGGFARLVAPPAPQAKDWQILASTREGEPAQMLQAQGAATFDYTLIPVSTEARTTPLIPYSYFDPIRAVYVDLSIPSVPVNVLPGRTPPDLAAALHSETKTDPAEEELTLSGPASAPGRGAANLLPLQRQAWFRFLQLAPIGVFLGLTAWDRRRRYLDAHPEILLRRRARRALRKERQLIRRAAKSGDLPSFAAAAVRALCIGSAPHFPARPDALVGNDVVELLTQNGTSQISGGETIIRRFFTAMDASRFSNAPATTNELFGLHAQLEQVLERMEAQL